MTTALEHPDLLDKARLKGMTISLDCSWDGQTLSRNDLSDVVSLVDIFLPNEDEAKALEAQGACAEPILATIIKQGAKGATCLSRGGSPVHAAGHAVQVVDTTGAGDAFNAGFLSAWLSGRSMGQALQLGNVCGATAVSRVGGAGMLPDLTDLSEPLPDGQAAQ
jgi:sugar/nucleoside kinase (ribokinase family)